jgi:hypothetical protein
MICRDGELALSIYYFCERETQHGHIYRSRETPCREQVRNRSKSFCSSASPGTPNGSTRQGV